MSMNIMPGEIVSKKPILTETEALIRYISTSMTKRDTEVIRQYVMQTGLFAAVTDNQIVNRREK